MSERKNNEIDSLLRGLARGARAASAEQGLVIDEEFSGATSAHLDADEMSAYAERALPEGARARYTAHLADCVDCRKIVTQLSVAAGLPASENVVEREAIASTWREKIARLFAPDVWRYAMPALVLILVVGVGYLALRQKSETSLVAENKRPEQPQSAVASNPGPQAEAPAQVGTNASGSPAPSANRSHSPTPEANASASNNAGPTSEATATPTEAVAVDKDASKKTAADQPVAAAAPPAPPPAADSTNAAPAAKTTDEIRAEEASAEKKKEAERKTAAGGATGTVAAPRRAGIADSRAARSESARDGEDGTETRSVAGHRFHRRNGVWIDVTFTASRSTISVARGSEQYRALIADEPGIRLVAEQLSGPVIVVWNGHAYRIH